MVLRALLVVFPKFLLFLHLLKMTVLASVWTHRCVYVVDWITVTGD